MDEYSLAHLSDGALLSGLKSQVGRERDALALVLAHLAEVETRELFKPAGYSSMQLYCVHELHLSKDAANKRIRAARLARDFPVVFQRVADGAIRLTALLILGASITAENVDELLTASAHRSDFEVREILAERFPLAPTPTTIEPVAEQGALVVPTPSEGAGEVREVAVQPLHGVVNSLQLKPIGAGLYKATLTMSRAMREKLCRAKDLLGYRKSEPDEAARRPVG